MNVTAAETIQTTPEANIRAETESDRTEHTGMEVTIATSRSTHRRFVRRRDGQGALCHASAAAAAPMARQVRAAFLVVGQARVLHDARVAQLMMLNAIQSFGALPSVFAAVHADSEREQERMQQQFASSLWRAPNLEHTEAVVSLSAGWAEEVRADLRSCNGSTTLGDRAFGYRAQTYLWHVAANMALAHQRRAGVRFDWFVLLREDVGFMTQPLQPYCHWEPAYVYTHWDWVHVVPAQSIVRWNQVWPKIRAAACSGCNVRVPLGRLGLHASALAPLLPFLAFNSWNCGA